MQLSDFFAEHPRVAVAFSGGVDSSYLLYSAKKNGSDVTAYYVRTAFQPEFEYKDAARLADDVLFLNEGRAVEHCGVKEFFECPAREETKRFLEIEWR